jgi:hypothetical protein
MSTKYTALYMGVALGVLVLVGLARRLAQDDPVRRCGIAAAA